MTSQNTVQHLRPSWSVFLSQAADVNFPQILIFSFDCISLRGLWFRQLQWCQVTKEPSYEEMGESRCFIHIPWRDELGGDGSWWFWATEKGGDVSRLYRPEEVASTPQILSAFSSTNLPPDHVADGTDNRRIKIKAPWSQVSVTTGLWWRDKYSEAENISSPHNRRGGTRNKKERNNWMENKRRIWTRCWLTEITKQWT